MNYYMVETPAKWQQRANELVYDLMMFDKSVAQVFVRSAGEYRYKAVVECHDEAFKTLFEAMSDCEQTLIDSYSEKIALIGMAIGIRLTAS